MLDIFAQGAGAFGVLLVALPWLLLFMIPFVVAIVFPIYYMIKHRKNQKTSDLKILVVDDDESSVLSLVSILSGKASDICIAESAESMLSELRKNQFDILFVDRMMPKQNGDIALAIADSLANSNKKGGTPVIFFTGNNRGLIIPRLSNFRVLEVWDKQVGYKVLEEKVSRVLKKVNALGH